MQRITHRAIGGESGVDWSPRTGRLALCEGVNSGNGLLIVWDGQKMTTRLPWPKGIPAPFYAKERVWQCRWSPDEKSLLLRFYGHAERDRESSGHLTVLDPRTGRERFDWGAEGGDAEWLDNTRLAFRGEHYRFLAEPAPLVVAEPATGAYREWLTNVIAWTLSPRRDTLWALTARGDLYRSPTSARQWTRLATGISASTAGTRLMLSPSGDLLAVWASGDSKLTLVAASAASPRKQVWRSPQGVLTGLGWQKGQRLPLVAVSQSEDRGPWQVWQLHASP